MRIRFQSAQNSFKFKRSSNVSRRGRIITRVNISIRIQLHSITTKWLDTSKKVKESV